MTSPLIAAYIEDLPPGVRDLDQTEGVVFVDDEPWAPHVTPGPRWNAEPTALIHFLREMSLSHGRAKVIPFCDALVLPAAWVNDTLGTGGLGYSAAISCMNRLYLRRVLDNSLSADLNPEWWEGRDWESIDVHHSPVVVKQCGSSWSGGVRVCQSRDEIEDFLDRKPCTVARSLEHFCPPTPVIERLIEGDHYEISGWIGDSMERRGHFGRMKQTWDRPAGRITEYGRAGYEMATELSVVCDDALRRLKLRWTGFCMEFIYSPRTERWTLIEVNLRLGRDPFPYFTVSGGYDEFMPDELVLTELVDLNR